MAIHDTPQVLDQIRTLLAVRIEAIERDLHLCGQQEAQVQLAQANLGRARVHLMNVLKSLEGHQYEGVSDPTTGSSKASQWIGGPFGYAGNPYPGEG